MTDWRLGEPWHILQTELVGRWCLVLLDRDDPEGWVEGKLLSVTDEGDAQVLGADGLIRYCWPVLEARLIERPTA